MIPTQADTDWRFAQFTPPGGAVDWAALQRYDWVRAFEGVPQNPVYHAEGDVDIHVRMVLEALVGLPGYAALPVAKQHLLYVATLLHDIAKPACTVFDADGRPRSPRHAQRGRPMARAWIYREMPVPFAVREHIVQLVRYHGLPLWWHEKRNSQAAVLQASQLVDMQLLALLAEADVLGRIAADQAELRDRVELFREYCKEQGCWEGPYPFADGHNRFAYFQNPGNGPLYQPYDDAKSEVLMLSGLPGSGKNTWIGREGPDWPVVSLDALRKTMKVSPREKQGAIIQAAKEAARVHLRQGQSFIWNATNLYPDIRKQLINLFREYRARVRIHYIEVPYADLLRQNRDREAVVPQPVIDKMIRRWEVPEIWEGHVVNYQVRD